MRKGRRIALVAMPWPLFNRPSIQLGVLKGYLQKTCPELEVRNYHPYLHVAARIGFELYHQISSSSWLAEALAAVLLFPEQREKLEAFVARLCRAEGITLDFTKVVSGLQEGLEAYLAEVSWEGYAAVGFSVCLNQLLSSLWGARWLKSRFPHLPIIFGGSNCAEEMGKGLLEVFPEVDFVVNGEGEKPLQKLVEHLIKGASIPETGVFYRKGAQVQGGGMDQLAPEELPSPIYDDYLAELSSLPPQKRFFPLIPLEASRGCWWFKCRFCNLNLQWRGFRRKPLAQVLKEIRLHARSGLLDFAFMDNCLPPKEALELFSTLAREGVDYRFFAELRAVYKRKEYHLLRQGGLTWVQIGIEALSTDLLARLNKGTTTIENLAAMRHCEEADLKLEGNLILEFPGSTQKEVEETLQNLEFAFPFRPLTPVSFWLGYGSPVFRNPKTFGLKALFPHPFYRQIFPPSILRRLVPLIWGYRGDREVQRKQWKPVRKALLSWRERYEKYQKKGPLLSFRDGGNFLLLRQVLPGGQILHHRLQGPSREVYLFLTDIRTLEELKGRFPRLSSTRLLAFLNDLQRKRLIFREGDRFLALAIHKTHF